MSETEGWPGTGDRAFGPKEDDAGFLEGRSFAFLSHLDFNLYRFRLPLMRRLVALGAQVTALSPPGHVCHRFGIEGVDFRAVAIDRRTIDPVKALGSIRGLAGVLRQVEPDVLQAFTMRANVYGLMAGRRAAVPLRIATVTGLGSLQADRGNPRSKMRTILAFGSARRALRHASAVVFQNPDDRAYFLERGLCWRHQARLIVSSGVDTEDFSPDRVSAADRAHLREERGIGPDEVVVTMVARLIAPKGVREFLRAASILEGRARFILIGEPDPANPYSMAWEEVVRLVDRTAVLLVGWQDDVRRWLGASDVYALPSYYREGIPRTVLEAMAMGLPVVTTDAPGCRETVVEGENGFLVPPRNTQALANALSRLVDDPELRRRMGDRGRRLALGRFSAEAVVEGHLALYRELLTGDWNP